MVLWCMMITMWMVGMVCDPKSWEVSLKSILENMGLTDNKSKRFKTRIFSFLKQLSKCVASKSVKKSKKPVASSSSTKERPRAGMKALCRLVLLTAVARVHNLPNIMTTTEVEVH